jgi:dTDP-4-amino-4,6-dideoxygalactose transaminase
MIPFFDLKAQYKAIKDEIRPAVDDVLESGWFILGSRLEKFEREFAAYVGVKHAIGVANGTDAIALALRSAGVGPGDKVVTVPNTAVPTVAAIVMAGASPVLVDVDSQTLLMDPARLEEAFKKENGIKAVIPVHLFGQTCDMDAITGVAKRHGAVVIEDACQAHGSLYKGKKAGSMGLLGCFSFYPTKNLGAYGDAGLVTTDDAGLADRLGKLRNYGQRDRYNSIIEGVNSRLDDLQAAILSIKLKHLDAWNKRRRHLAGLYDEAFKGCGAVRPVGLAAGSSGDDHARHLYVIRHSRRDALRKFLDGHRVATLIHYPIPIHLQEAYSGLGYAQGSLPIAEKASIEIASLPIYPELSDADALKIAGLIKEFGGEA